jgi:heptaprenyl diphosphate synthase
MTASIIELVPGREDIRVARLAALAVGLTLAEAAIPSPIPGVKPGLANIVVLLVLYRHGLRAAVWVSALRVLGASLLLGYFLTPGFFLSAIGAATSLAALAIAGRLPAAWFGPVSASILAAFAHVAGQFLLAWTVLIPHAGILYLAPVFAAAALVSGLVNGIIAARLLGAEASCTTAQAAA